MSHLLSALRPRFGHPTAPRMGRIMPGQRTRPHFRAPTAPEGTFTAVGAGQTHSCAIRANGYATCWGNNVAGQSRAPFRVPFSAITAGAGHTCGLRTDGTITCWGSNQWNSNHTGQAQAPRGTFSAVTAGLAHTCGLRTDGTITCWGRNNFGQAEAPSGTFLAVDAGGDWLLKQDGLTCAIYTTGAITCWGYWRSNS